MRSHERDGSAAINDPSAEHAAQQAGGDFEHRIVTRAANLSIARQLRDSLHQVNTVMIWIIAIGVLLALIAGAATARATLGVDGPGVANFYWVLGGVLGVQTIALLLWAIVFTWATLRSSPANAPATVSLGSIVLGVGQWIAGKLHQQSEHTAAVQAAGRVFTHGPIGRWLFSSITHGLWLAFNIGCLLMIIVLLSARQYTFVWETTILTEDHYITLTQAIATVPDAVGFATPTEEQIAASQRREGQPLPETAREAWSSLLAGCIVVYGLGPRLLLLGLSLSGFRASKRRFRLDRTLPGYARLERRLADQPSRITDPDGDGGELPAEQHPPAAHRDRPTGQPAVLGIEINRPDIAWPPQLPGVSWDDLGVLEDRDDRRRAVDQLTNADTEPARLVIACDLTTTPDRGIARLVRQLRSLLTRDPLVLLTGGHALRSRGLDAAHVAQRVEDWQQLAAGAGVQHEHVLEVDLEHLTDANAQRISSFISPNGEAAASSANTRRIEQAFDHIVEHVHSWASRNVAADDAAAHAELHRAIAKTYSNEAGSLRDMLNAPRSLDAGDLTATLKDSAQRAVNLLPDRLRKSPKWLAAGAMSGALGCVAAATLLSPVAIAALPTWSLIGAAIAAAAQPSSKKPDTATPEHDFGDAVRSAALFAMLLELQGRDETTITHVLDRVLDQQSEQPVPDAAAARAMLDHLRHRLDLALAEVAS